MTVSFPSSCSMTVSATGLPYQHQANYLTPVMAGGTVVATTPSGIQLGVSPYAGSGLSTSAKAIAATFNTCPTKAASTTASGGGAIGLIFSGTVLFDAYEATNTVALGDNASYTFASTGCGGTTCTAAFIDPCNQHTTGGTGGSTWHYHGVPSCWTAVADGSSTSASHIIGIALDGYPIYGGYDVNGKAVDPSTLDACNGITSATLSAEMKRLACKMPFLLADGNVRLPDGREVSRKEADAWMRMAMPEMEMASASGVKRGDGRRSSMSMPGM